MNYTYGHLWIKRSNLEKHYGKRCSVCGKFYWRHDWIIMTYLYVAIYGPMPMYGPPEKTALACSEKCAEFFQPQI